MSGLIVLGHDHHISEMINPKILEQAEEYFEKEIHWTPGKSAPMKRGKRK